MLSIRAGMVLAAAGAALAGSVSLASQVLPDAKACDAAPSDRARTGSGAGHDHSDGHERGHGQGQHSSESVTLGPTCNTVEMVAPHRSEYRPDIVGASRADRAQARALLEGVNEFCRDNSASRLQSEWVPGTSNPDRPTHFFNPRSDDLGLDPTNPRAALIYQGRLGGVMFTGTPLPSLGSIPRAHTHDESGRREMVHVYCTDDLRDAFTPNRMLGVMAETRALRSSVRPKVSSLEGAALDRVLRKVRRFAGDAVPPVATDEAPTHVDPRTWAKREEVRRSLMVLTEDQLRRVRSSIGR